MDTLSQLASHLPIVLIVVGLLLLLIVLYVIFLVVRSSPQLRAEAPPPAPPPGEAPPLPPAAEGPSQGSLARSLELRRVFRRTVRNLRRLLGSRDAVYRLPFFLSVGAAGAADPEMWQSSDLNLPFGIPPESSQRSDRCNFWIYDRGLLIDVGGDFVRREDGSGDESGFRQILGLLQKYRSARPLDGVILPISAQELQHARGPEGYALLEQRADAVYHALWQIQKQLGMLFPVYVVITGGENVPGVAALANSLPDPLRGEMLGWSNPYHLGQTYRSEWIEEAFGALGRDLRAAQKEAFAEGVPPAVGESLLLLPTEAASLEEPLRRYLDRVFKGTAYHEPIPLRGIYLTARDRGRSRSLFLRDLLEGKVFSEFALARPAPRALIARRRVLRIAQWAAAVFFVLLAIGSVRSYTVLSREKGELEAFFGESLRSLRDLRRLQVDGEAAERSVAQRWARRVLEGAAPIRRHVFGSLFIPHSWSGAFQKDVDQSLARVFQTVLFATMRDAYEDRARTLTTDALSAPAPERLADPRFFDPDLVDPEPPAIDQSRQLAELRTYLGNLSQLERHAELFNDLRLKGNPTDLAKLAADPRDSLAVKLGDTPFANPVMIDRMLKRQLDRVDLARFAPAAQQRTVALTGALTDFMDNNQLAAGLENLAYEIDQLDEADSGAARTAAYRRVLEKLRWTRTELTQPGHEWIFRDTFQLGAAFDEALTAGRGSSLVGDAGAREISRTVEAAWIGLRRRLAEVRSRFTGALLQVERGEPRMALSGDLQLLEVALEGLLGEDFMGEEGSREPRPFAPGNLILWDAALLENAAALYEPYQRFRSRGLDAFPPDLRTALDQVARGSLADRIAALVAEAQSFRPESSPSHSALFEQELHAATANLLTAAPLLEKLQSTFGDLDQWNRQQALQLLVARQAGALLRQLDEMVEREQPYYIRGGDFSWWRGEGPVGFETFDKASLAETTLYLDSQRRRLQQLAVEIGQPLAALLSKTGFHQQPEYRVLFERWDGITNALQAYDAKKPGGSLETLEKYLLDELPQTSLASCVQEPPPPLRSGDYFAVRLAEVRRALSLRCGDLRGDLAVGHWRRLESFFNQRLAGRYPFAPPSAAATSAALSDDLRAFFRLFDEALPLLRASEGGRGPLLPIAAEMKVFLDEMAGVRAFFAPFLDAKVRSAEPFYDLDVEMRVNREHELCGEQIIEWVLDRDGLAVDQRTTGKTVRWQPGQPLELRLRWAKDAPALPAGGGGDRAGFYVDGSWAVWRFADRWALLHLLEALAAEPQDFTAFEDPAPHTLRLAAALQKAPAFPAGDPEPPPAAAGVTDKACPADAAETRVFVRLRVLAPEDKALLVRKPFPTAAPRLPDFSSAPPLPPVKAPR